MAMALRIKIEHPAKPAVTIGGERQNFWNTLESRVPDKTAWELWQLSEHHEDADWYRILEINFRDRFPWKLQDSLYKRLQQIGGPRELNIRLIIVDLEYGSLEVLLAALGIERAAAIYGLALPAMMSIIEASVPEAFRQAVTLPSPVDLNVTVTDEDAPSLSPSATASDPVPDTMSSRVAQIVQAFRNVAVSYLGAILLAGFVLWFAASAAFDAIRTAATERTALMQGYTDLTKQQLTALSDERKEMVKAAEEATKAASAERAALAQTYTDLTKQQLTALSDERKEIAKLAGTLLHDGDANRQALGETLRKITTEEHGQSLEILRPAAEKGRETPAVPR